MEESKSEVGRQPERPAHHRAHKLHRNTCVGQKDTILGDTIYPSNALTLNFHSAGGRVFRVCRTVDSVVQELRAQEPMADWVHKPGETLDVEGYGGRAGKKRFYRIAIQSARIWITKESAARLLSIKEGPAAFDIVPIMTSRRLGRERTPLKLRLGNTDSEMGMSMMHGQLPGEAIHRVRNAHVSSIAAPGPKDKTMPPMEALHRANNFEMVVRGAPGFRGETIPVPDWRRMPWQVAASGGSTTLLKHLISAILTACDRLAALNTGVDEGFLEITTPTAEYSVMCTAPSDKGKYVLRVQVDVDPENVGLKDMMPKNFDLSVVRSERFAVGKSRFTFEAKTNCWQSKLRGLLPALLVGSLRAEIYINVAASPGLMSGRQKDGYYEVKTPGFLLEVPKLIASMRRTLTETQEE